MGLYIASKALQFCEVTSDWLVINKFFSQQELKAGLENPELTELLHDQLCDPGSPM